MTGHLAKASIDDIVLDFQIWWIYDQQSHLAYVPENLSKAGIFYISLDFRV